MHCETQQRSLPRLLTLNAPMTGLRIPRAMNLPSRGRRADSAGDESASRGRRVNTSNASPLWVSEIDLNNVAVMPAPVVIGPDGQGCAAARRADRRHAAAADSGDRARPRPRSRPPANASKEWAPRVRPAKAISTTTIWRIRSLSPPSKPSSSFQPTLPIPCRLRRSKCM